MILESAPTSNGPGRDPVFVGQHGLGLTMWKGNLEKPTTSEFPVMIWKAVEVLSSYRHAFGQNYKKKYFR